MAPLKGCVVGHDGVVTCPFQDSLPEIPKGSIAMHIMRRLEENGSKIALTDGVTGEHLTSAALRQRSLKVASGLRRRGFLQGQVLCVIALNDLNYPALFLATALNGGVMAPLSPGYNDADLEPLLRNSGASWIVAGEGQEEKAKRLSERVGGIKAIFTLGKEGVQGCSSFQELLEDPGDLYLPHTQVNAEKDLVMLPYSSGTTGVAKGVMVTHANLAAAYMLFRDKRTLGLGTDDVILLFLPFCHSLGFIIMFASLINDYSAVMIPKFSPKTFLQVIQDYKVTFMASVPTVVLFLAQAPIVDEYDIASLKGMFCGGAPLSGDVQEALQKRTGGNLTVRQAYGMTESVAPVTFCCQENRVGSVGQVTPHMQVKVADLKTRSLLGPMQEGEICVRGPAIVPGYYRNETATSGAFDKDDWLLTGDVGYYDQDGFLYIVDRIKELIKFKGLQVAPAELEGVLLKHPDVVDAAVVGRGDERAGELPTGFVVLKAGSLETTQGILKHVEDRVSDFKQLRGGVVFVDSIPKTVSGKILRKDLKKLLLEKENGRVNAPL
ncbi:probable 4-coumarate--CoA ligase 1 [Macrobrachium rosenbergii]|uniref:probable 4-coumarate--CoA ligase 1 n=1 Tax=Macrobrachium rosenbergii TaxID=79674 RepID=UPI0034D3C57A